MEELWQENVENKETREARKKNKLPIKGFINLCSPIRRALKSGKTAPGTSFHQNQHLLNPFNGWGSDRQARDEKRLNKHLKEVKTQYLAMRDSYFLIYSYHYQKDRSKKNNPSKKMHNLPRTNPSLAHCTRPRWFATSHSKIEVDPSTTCWSLGTAKNCWSCWHKTVQRRQKNIRLTDHLLLIKKNIFSQSLKFISVVNS